MREFKPKSEHQADYIRAMAEHDMVFCIGPAGSGKTACAVGQAVRYFIDDDHPIKKLILIRPTIGTDEDRIDDGIGFLKGDMLEKMSPFIRPLTDELLTYIDRNTLRNYLEQDIIEVLPLYYARGRTFHKSFVIVDECQNASFNQIQMITTRLGSKSKMVLNGDMDQHDRKRGVSDFQIWIEKIIGEDPEIPVCELYKEDIVRHHLVRKILEKVEIYKNDG